MELSEHYIAQQDADKGFYWARRGADSGERKPQAYLGALLVGNAWDDDGSWLEERHIEGISLLKKAAQQGCIVASYYLYAYYSDHEDEGEEGENLKWLAKFQADNVNADDVEKKAVRRFAAKRTILDDIEKGDIAAVQQAIDVGLDVNACYGRRWPEPLLLYCASQPEILELLLKNGADPNCYDESILHSWIERSDITALRKESVKLLLDHGVDINIEESGYTPLHKAVARRNFDVMKWLIEWGADINAEDAAGETVLDMAVRNKYNIDIIEFLCSKGAMVGERSDILHHAVRQENIELVKFLLAHGANPDNRSEWDFAGTPAELAQECYKTSRKKVFLKIKKLLSPNSVPSDTPPKPKKEKKVKKVEDEQLDLFDF